MEVEVMTIPPPPAAAAEFHFDSTSSSPFITAPSTPQRFGNFFHHPTAPTAADLSSYIPFDWEEKPGTPKNTASESSDLDGDEFDFEFDFSGQLERSSLSAEELFDGGKIRPLKPPPGHDHFSGASSPKSPKYIVSKKKEFDPFEAALEQSKKSVELEEKPILLTRQRGRRNRTASESSSYVHKGSRSMSPLRVAGMLTETEQHQPPRVSVTETSSTSNSANKSSASSIFSSFSFSKTHRKWSFKDFLFRSASEGRASEKDPVAKYALLSRKAEKEVRNSSFRSTESSGGSFSRRRGRVSAHELHYAANRAVTEEMKRKTFLPYKQGLLGCLGFSPGGCGHEVSRGIGSMTRGV